MKQKKSNKLKLFLLLGLVVVLAVIVTAVSYVLQSGENQAPEESEASYAWVCSRGASDCVRICGNNSSYISDKNACGQYKDENGNWQDKGKCACVAVTLEPLNCIKESTCINSFCKRVGHIAIFEELEECGPGFGECNCVPEEDVTPEETEEDEPDPTPTPTSRPSEGGIGGGGDLPTSTPSLTPTSSPTVTLTPTTASADFNGDGDVTIADFSLFVKFYSGGNSKADLNKDTKINIGDFMVFRDEYILSMG